MDNLPVQNQRPNSAAGPPPGPPLKLGRESQDSEKSGSGSTLATQSGAPSDIADARRRPDAALGNIPEPTEREVRGSRKGLKIALGIVGALILSGGFLIWVFNKEPVSPGLPELPFAGGPATDELITDQEPEIINKLEDQPVFIPNEPPVDDLDEDGLLNTEETLLGTDPNDADTDRDGLSDYQEVRIFSTNPILPDSDSDGLRDGEEFLNGSDPSSEDTDDDGLNDWAEVNTWQTNPANPDTDGDGYNDGAEVAGGFDPLTPAGSDGDPSTSSGRPLGSDSDSDGLTDADEVNVYGTNPQNADTDGDTFPDGVEVANGYNPLGPGKLSE